MPKCLVVQHVPPESAFAIGDALRRAGVTVDVRHVFAGDAVPDNVAGLNGLVVMGGPMSAASDDGFATRSAEIALLAGAVQAQIPTLGVCLGAQLLAIAGGAAVHPGEPGPEIGWLPVSLLEAAGDDRLFAGLDRTMTVLHWHGDTFDIPPDGRHLARSARYANQAFRIGDAAWGVQFHLEVDVNAVDGFVSEFSADLADRASTSAEIRARTPEAVAALAPMRDLVLSRFAALVAAHATRTDFVGRP